MANRPAASPLSDLLAELVGQARRNIERSSRLIAQAKAACLRASRSSDDSQLHRDERAAWAEILAGIPVDPEHIIVLCARCHRVKASHGWSALPHGIEEALIKWPGARVSHGYCSECVRELEAGKKPPSRPPGPARVEQATQGRRPVKGS